MLVAAFFSFYLFHIKRPIEICTIYCIYNLCETNNIDHTIKILLLQIK
jgi:hypothetical protein